MLEACLTELSLTDYASDKSHVNYVFTALYELEMLRPMPATHEYGKSEKSIDGELSSDMATSVDTLPIYCFEELDNYHRQFSYYHVAKVDITNSQQFSLFDTLQGTFLAKNIFKQIVMFGSYERFREMILKLVRSKVTTSSEEKQQIIHLSNTLYLVE